jgi:hypothetical protein
MKKPLIVIAIVASLLLLIVGCNGGQQSPNAAQGVNFRFLISDEPNAIEDFENLYVTISSIGVRGGGESGNWSQFAPDKDTVDLKPLVGKNAREIWSGNLTPGQYNKVFIYVSDVEGILTDNETARVKLPSNKLQISTPFEVTEDSITSFVFDITVIKAGRSGMYVLTPQIAESGADKEIDEVEPEDMNGEDEDEEELELQLEGDARPGAEIVLVVLQADGSPADGAIVTVNDQDIGTTDSEGRIDITLPVDEEEVELEATLGDSDGELELEFEEETGEIEIEGTLDTIDGNTWTVMVDGESRTVDVSSAEIDGEPEEGDQVEIEGSEVDGIVIATEVEVE